MARSQSLDRTLGQLEVVLANAAINNKKKKEQEEAIQDLSSHIHQCNEMLRIMKNVHEHLVYKAAKFREDRQEALESAVKRALRLVFPEEGFEFKIHWDASRGRPTAKILTGFPDATGKMQWHIPGNTHGEFAKQLIGFTIIVNICIMLGAAFFYGDECLNSGDDESLNEVKPLLDEFMEIIQLIVIEHKEAFYSDMPRRVISLLKIPGVNSGGIGEDSDPFAGHVEICGIEDIIPECEEM